MFPPDEILITVYAAAKVPADRVALEQQARQQFMSHLPDTCRDCDPEKVAKRLVYLRKKGLLARLQRTAASKSI